MGHRRKHHRAYGVVWDEGTSSPAGVRVGQGNSAAVSTKLPDNLQVIQNAMKRCLLQDNGTVNYYLDPNDSTLKTDGNPSDLTGTDGQVMVEIPLVWLKYSYNGTEHTWMISREQFNGASRLEAFRKNGAWTNKRYMSAYEGTLYDVSASIYANGIYQTAVSCVFANADSSLTIVSRTGVFSKLAVGDKLVVSGTADNNGTFTVASLESATKITVDEAVTDGTDAATVITTEKDWVNDTLCSVSGKAPINQGTRANFRAIAAKRGTGWRQQDYDLISAIQLLYLIEYASWYSQSMIGAGLTDWSSAWPAYNDYNPINFTGLTNSLGNATGNLSNGNGVVGSYMSYRGIENFFGHLWKWVDGINININVPYVCNDDTDFADDTATAYTALGITLAAADGYQMTLEQMARGFLPASIGGASNTYITDYYYQSTGWRVVTLGGAANNGANAGIACLAASAAASYLHRNLGGRLCF